MFKKVMFAGSLWWVVFEECGLYTLVSIDRKQIKRGIDKSMTQLIDEFSDPYPEE